MIFRRRRFHESPLSRWRSIVYYKRQGGIGFFRYGRLVALLCLLMAVQVEAQTPVQRGRVLRMYLAGLSVDTPTVTQAKLASLTGISTTRISAIARGVDTATVVERRKIINVLDSIATARVDTVTQRWLMTAIQDARANRVPPAPPLPPLRTLAISYGEMNAVYQTYKLQFFPGGHNLIPGQAIVIRNHHPDLDGRTFYVQVQTSVGILIWADPAQHAYVRTTTNGGARGTIEWRAP